MGGPHWKLCRTTTSGSFHTPTDGLHKSSSSEAQSMRPPNSSAAFPNHLTRSRVHPCIARALLSQVRAVSTASRSIKHSVSAKRSPVSATSMRPRPIQPGAHSPRSPITHSAKTKMRSLSPPRKSSLLGLGAHHARSAAHSGFADSSTAVTTGSRCSESFTTLCARDAIGVGANDFYPGLLDGSPVEPLYQTFGV